MSRLRSAINPGRIDLVSLRLVVLCVESGTLSSAARLANLSISGASHRLGLLEQALGRKLFVRHHRGLSPTRAGEVVASNARLMLGTLEHLSDSLARLAPALDTVEA